MKNKVFFGLLSLMLCACSSSKGNAEAEETEEEGLPVINLSEGVEEVKQLNLSDAVERLEIVKLESTNRSLVRPNTDYMVTDNDIWVMDPLNSLLRFSRQGKFLNRVGKRGQGPKEYSMLSSFFVDDNAKEVYIQGSSAGGIQVYDYEGNHIRQQTRRMADDYYSGEPSTRNPFFRYHDRFFVVQNLAVFKPIANPVDSLWSIALMDEDFLFAKLFKNPDHVGHENDICLDKNRADPYGETNRTPFQWRELPHAIDFYGDEMTVMFSNTDTIYRFEEPTLELVPQYVVETHEPKCGFELMHQWPSKRERLSYFYFSGYFPTRDYIYLLGQKEGDTYIYQYDKNHGSVKLLRHKGGIRESRWGSELRYSPIDNYFRLTNDFTGGSFKVVSIFSFLTRSQGKYWFQVLDPGAEEFEDYVEEVKASPDAPQKQQLLDVIAKTGEEDNPILLIAVLK